MSLYGPWISFEIDISDSTTLSDEVDLGGNYDYAAIVVPTIDTAQVTVRVNKDEGGTAKDLYVTDPADGGNNKVISASGTGDFVWVVPIFGFQFLKLFTSAAMLADRTFWIRGIK